MAGATRRRGSGCIRPMPSSNSTPPFASDLCMLRSSARHHCDRTISPSVHPEGDLTYAELDAAANRAAHALLAWRSAHSATGRRNSGPGSCVDRVDPRDSQGRIGLCATRPASAGVGPARDGRPSVTRCPHHQRGASRRVRHACGERPSRHRVRPACRIRYGRSPMVIPRPSRFQSIRTPSPASSTRRALRAAPKRSPTRTATSWPTFGAT